MVGYKELALMRTFTSLDAEELTSNKKTASSLLYRLMKKGMVKKIKNNLYTCVNIATGETLASKYHIACACSPSAYLSHHTALEYHGVANQPYYEAYVSSDSRFSNFTFEDISYKYVASKLSEGITTPKNSEGIRVTDLERTIVDSIKDFEKIGGLDELLNCLSLIHFLDEKKLTKYLDSYNIQALHQKTGFILEHYMRETHLTKEFIDYCKSKIGKSTRYLAKDVGVSGVYKREWRLIVPIDLFSNVEGGGELV